MLRLMSLPTALVHFVLLATPIFATEGISRNNLLRSLELRKPPQKTDPDAPICCLRPLTPTLDNAEDDILVLSFEQWKEKQLQNQDPFNAQPPSGSPRNGQQPPARDGPNATHNLSAHNPVPTPGPNLSFPPSPASPDTANSDMSNVDMESPHISIPLTDRFNYASLDCSARVHRAHRSAKSTSSILSSKRDRYMLSPCSRKGEKEPQQKFVEVELCEDVRIDTVQLANFEFFSGVFKEFTVSVAKTYNAQWTIAGTYTAKNVRGVQSFHPPTSLRGFYRFIRIDFYSHYGNEYYCPVSLLRVYGLTHLEEWKWEMWKEESKAKMATRRPGIYSAVEEPHDQTVVQNAEKEAVVGQSFGTKSMDIADVLPASPLPDSVPALAISSAQGSNGHATTPSTMTEQHASSATPEPPVASVAPSEQDASPVAPSNPPPTGTAESQPKATNTATFAEGSPSSENANPTSAPVASGPAVVTTTITASTSIFTPTYAVAPGGESIYRTIMNRLLSIEMNQTLYVRYVEDHTKGVREMMRRIGEDIGRVEGIGQSQMQAHQRSIREWERERRRLELEYSELLEKVEYLTEEIELEKRLGIAQLCLLLAVLVFVALTRGSRSEHAPQLLGPNGRIFKTSMREWGKRHLSFSGDWVSRFTRSRTPSRVRSPPVEANSTVRYDFPRVPSPPPSQMTPKGLRPSKYPPTLPLSDRRPRPRRISIPKSSTSTVRSRSNTRTPIPSKASKLPTAIASALPQHRPLLRRSSSHGERAVSALPATQSFHTTWEPVHVPRSAKRWARTAHLHEVRRKDGKENRADALGATSDASEEDSVFSISSAPGRKPPLNAANGTLRPTIWPSENGQLSFLVDSKTPTKGKVNIVEHNGVEGDLWVDTDTDSDSSNPGDTDVFESP